MSSAIQLANLSPAWKAGQSGNPKGRPSAGLAVKEWLNLLAFNDLTEEDWLKVYRDKREPGNKRLAALHLIRSLENPDAADYEPALDGQMSLRELRVAGIATTSVKKMKKKERSVPQKEGDPIIEVEREIEFHDRSGAAFDRILDRTDGKPMQPVSGAEGSAIEVVVKVIAGVSMNDV